MDGSAHRLVVDTFSLNFERAGEDFEVKKACILLGLEVSSVLLSFLLYSTPDLAARSDSRLGYLVVSALFAHF